jgi:hypothetical protein
MKKKISGKLGMICLIATGASPIVPNMENIDASGVFALSTLQSGIDVFNFIEEKKPAKAVIVGGGYIGMEMAEAFLNRSMDVTLIDMAPQLMATLDKDMADLILEYMKEKQVKVFLEEKLVKFEKNDEGSVKSVITDKQTIPADIVILGMGVKPNSELAAQAGIKLGANDAIQVNKRLETSADPMFGQQAIVLNPFTWLHKNRFTLLWALLPTSMDWLQASISAAETLSFPAFQELPLQNSKTWKSHEQVFPKKRQKIWELIIWHTQSLQLPRQATIPDQKKSA